MKRKVWFLDAKNNRVNLSIEVKTNDKGQKELSMSADMGSSGGQCQGSIEPKGDEQARLIEIWNLYHLNGLNAGTQKQSKIIKEWQAKGNKYDYEQAKVLLSCTKPNGTIMNALEHQQYMARLKETKKDMEDMKKMTVETLSSIKAAQPNMWTPVNDSVYSLGMKRFEFKRNFKSQKDSKYLWANTKYEIEKITKHITQELHDINVEIRGYYEEAALKSMLFDEHPETGELHQYGHAWIHHPLPEGIEEEIEDLCEDIELLRSEDVPVTLEDKELFEDFDDPDAVHALAMHLELTHMDVEDIEEEGDCQYKVQGTYYHCGTEQETFDTVMEYMSEMLWAFTKSFLSTYGTLAKLPDNAVELVLNPLQEQCEGGNETIKELVEWDENKGHMAKDAIAADGVGHFLNGYDGIHHVIKDFDEDYTICRR